MQTSAALVSCSLLLSVAVPALAQVPETPNASDIPRPVPISLDLAGVERPDISRFLNVRAASSPSLAPDGSQLAFRSSTTGKPQLWVVDATSGWPHQLTFGESVTFNEWSPTGEWILYGSDRGGNEREGFYLINADGTRERELLSPIGSVPLLWRLLGGRRQDRVLEHSAQRPGLRHLHSGRRERRGEEGLRRLLRILRRGLES